MKKKFTLVLSALLIAGLAWDHNNQPVHGLTGGSPVSRTGSPGDGSSCYSGCHGGFPGTASGSEVVAIGGLPSGGYIPGNTYDLTFTLTDAAVSKFGFQLSPQNVAGDFLGTLISGTGTQIVGTGYLTHQPAATTSGSASWDFQWTAPTAGTGDVTFYSASIFANGAQGNAGDVMVTADRVVAEDLTIGINELDNLNLSVYPNPVVDVINIAFKDVDEEIMVTLYGIDGRLIHQKTYTQNLITVNVEAMDLTSGVYFLQLDVAGNSTVKKLLVK